jgi:ribosomal protein S18 acetylase RimI-like enzyme
VYGLPEQWPHVRAVLRRAGFTPGDRTEIVWLADVSALPRPPSPLAGLIVARTLGINGTRFTALLNGQPSGYLEVQQRSEAGRLVAQHGLADIGNLHVDPAHRRRGIAGWLLGQAADWLHLGHLDRLLDYCSPNDEGYRAFLQHAGFRSLTHTTRGWERPTGTAP